MVATVMTAGLIPICQLMVAWVFAVSVAAVPSCTLVCAETTAERAKRAIKMGKAKTEVVVSRKTKFGFCCLVAACAGGFRVYAQLCKYAENRRYHHSFVLDNNISR